MNLSDVWNRPYSASPRLGAVLFDLDGTLVDTAPGMSQALNRLLTSQGLEPLTHEIIRPHVSGGTRALLQLARTLTAMPCDEDPRWREAFLEHYAMTATHDVAFFPGIVELLATLGDWHVPWAIVTNKPQDLAESIMDFLRPQLDGRAAAPRCLVGGGSAFRPKPDPAGILHALACCHTLPQHAVMVGDDQRDIAAGHAAGVHTVAATYGYIPHHEQPASWQAHALCASPRAILDHLAILRTPLPTWQAAKG